MNSLARKVLFREAFKPLEARYLGNKLKTAALQAFRDRVIVDGKPFRASVEHPVISARYWLNETNLIFMQNMKVFRSLKPVVSSEMEVQFDRLYAVTTPLAALDRCMKKIELAYLTLFSLAILSLSSAPEKNYLSMTTSLLVSYGGLRLGFSLIRLTIKEDLIADFTDCDVEIN